MEKLKEMTMKLTIEKILQYRQCDKYLKNCVIE